VRRFRGGGGGSGQLALSCGCMCGLGSFNGLFGSVVAVTFQSVFHSEMHQNDVFFIF
jgi:hypothetical protein